MKWKDKAKESVLVSLKRIHEEMHTLFENNGEVDLSIIPKTHFYYDIYYVFSGKLMLSEEKEERSFITDDITPVRLEIENNELLKFWGKVSWLSTPKNHKNYDSCYDPLYIEMKLVKNELIINQILFGDYNTVNINKYTWVDREMEWMFEL